MAYASGALAQDTTLQRIADALETQSGSSEIIAPKEASSVSTHAYAIGEQFIYDGKLYTATAAIAIGDTIVTEGVGVNCTESDSITEQIGDTANSKVTFTSSDNDATTEKTSDGFTSVATMASGETHASLFQKISKMFLNIRKLWNTVGSTAIDTAYGTTVTAQLANFKTYNTYSTIETWTGKYWTDGKKIYSRIVDCGAIPSGALNQTIVYTFSGVDHIHVISAYTDNALFIPYIAPTDMSASLTFMIVNNDKTVRLMSGTDRSSFGHFYLIVEYTKTTN